MSYRIQNIILFLVALFIATSLFSQNKQIVLTINRTGSGDIQISTAPLKYNKDFAFSFTFDDGILDSYELGYRLLNGGISEVDGNNYPGIKFTNGTGRAICFNAGVAWYTANSEGTDIHNGNGAKLTYSHALQLYNNGWHFFNHSFDHSQDNPAINYLQQLIDNDQSFYNRVGKRLDYVIPPGGDKNYIQPAFSFGSPAVFTSNSSYAQSPGEPIQIDEKITSSQPVYWRNLINSDDDDAESLLAQARLMFDESGPGNHVWWNEFTHRVQYEKIGASFVFPEFRKYMEGLEAEYGRYGKDNGLFVNSTEVFEYLVVRDKLKISHNRSGNQEIIVLDFSDCPANFRYYDISLLMSGVSIGSMSVSGPATVSYSSHSNQYLVNISMPESYYSGVRLTELSDQKLSIFPNPAKQFITIYSTEVLDPNSVVKIIDIEGRIKLPKMIWQGPGEIYIDLTQTFIQPGLYFIVIESDNTKEFVQKIILK